MEATVGKWTLWKEKRKKTLRTMVKKKFLYLIFIPVFLYYFIFRYLPMLGLVIVFQDFRPFLGFFESTWVGIEHFARFLIDPVFWNVVSNTVILSLYGIIFSFPMPIILALLLNEIRNMAFKRTVQTISYLPFFMSIVVVVSLATSMLSPTMGPIGQLFRFFGMQPVHFLANVEHYRTIFIITDIWRTIGFSSIVFLAALAGVDQQLYEAATIDGAGRFKQLIYITLPSIMPTIIIMLILRIGGLMDSDFEMNFLLGNEATRANADVIATYVFRTGIVQSNFSFAAAVGLFNSVIALILVWGTNKLSRKTTETSLW